jgi:hypothetical protein
MFQAVLNAQPTSCGKPAVYAQVSFCESAQVGSSAHPPLCVLLLYEHHMLTVLTIIKCCDKLVCCAHHPHYRTCLYDATANNSTVGQHAYCYL